MGSWGSLACLLTPVDKFVDNLWTTLWISLWTNNAPLGLWITSLFIHNLSTAYPQVPGNLSTCRIPIKRGLSGGFPHIHRPYYYYCSLFNF